jgi:hypothetical protein
VHSDVRLDLPPAESTRPKPPPQLRGFVKIAKRPGATASVSFNVSRPLFEWGWNRGPANSCSAPRPVTSPSPSTWT